MEHPLNVFFLIQRFRTVWQLIDELVLNTDAFQGQHCLFLKLTITLKCLIFLIRKKSLYCSWYWTSLFTRCQRSSSNTADTSIRNESTGSKLSSWIYEELATWQGNKTAKKWKKNSSGAARQTSLCAPLKGQKGASTWRSLNGEVLCSGMISEPLTICSQNFVTIVVKPFSRNFRNKVTKLLRS